MKARIVLLALIAFAGAVIAGSPAVDHPINSHSLDDVAPFLMFPFMGSDGVDHP